MLQKPNKTPTGLEGSMHLNLGLRNQANQLPASLSSLLPLPFFAKPTSLQDPGFSVTDRISSSFWRYIRESGTPLQRESGFRKTRKRDYKSPIHMRWVSPIHMRWVRKLNEIEWDWVRIEWDWMRFSFNLIQSHSISFNLHSSHSVTHSIDIRDFCHLCRDWHPGSTRDRVCKQPNSSAGSLGIIYNCGLIFA